MSLIEPLTPNQGFDVSSFRRVSPDESPPQTAATKVFCPVSRTGFIIDGVFRMHQASLLREIVVPKGTARGRSADEAHGQEVTPCAMVLRGMASLAGWGGRRSPLPSCDRCSATGSI